MRISDWSSDVCSSDLLDDFPEYRHRAGHRSTACNAPGPPACIHLVDESLQIISLDLEHRDVLVRVRCRTGLGLRHGAAASPYNTGQRENVIDVPGHGVVVVLPTAFRRVAVPSEHVGGTPPI